MGSRLSRIIDWDGLAEKAQYNVKDLAALCGISLRQLERYIKTTFAQTPEQWVNEFRLKKAQKLLSDGHSVKETAFSLNYKQASHFCRQFKDYTGVRPNDSASMSFRAVNGLRSGRGFRKRF